MITLAGVAIDQQLWTSSPTIRASPVLAGTVLAGRPDSGPVRRASAGAAAGRQGALFGVTDGERGQLLTATDRAIKDRG